MTYKWQFTTDEENPEGYYQRLIYMNPAEVLSLEEAAERLNELEARLVKKRTSESDLVSPINITKDTVVVKHGLTKREYFAAMAMGDLTKYYDACAVGAVDIAQIAVTMADALIAELNKEQK